ncbi:UNKNOWN [Stylonychia lemnae]|uniref:Uncharacterized protein n=1 Tax=Stylonychia lemnae TaxID=5949 RepID=A0A078A1H6_STYLE|nr:UNKNOWN [Stylonychia lemnae]|eukprot:CDW74634.1 UNKNOWN [Stylonychia lemnae]
MSSGFAQKAVLQQLNEKIKYQIREKKKKEEALNWNNIEPKEQIQIPTELLENYQQTNVINLTNQNLNEDCNFGFQKIIQLGFKYLENLLSMNEFTQLEPQITNVDRPLIWVEKGSLEYQLFQQRLLDNQLERQNKKFVCVACWAFININEKNQHLEHKELIFNPFSIRDESSFLQLAADYGKINGSRVAILNNKCIFAEGTIGVDEGASQYSVICTDQQNPQRDNDNQPLQMIEPYPQQQMAAFSYKQALASPMKNPLLEFDNDIYEDAGSDIEETLRKAKRQQNLELRRSFFMPGYEKEEFGGPFGILGKEDQLSVKLGDSVAQDILYMAKRSKALRKEVLQMKEVIDVLYDLQYNNQEPKNIVKRIKVQQKQQQERFKIYQQKQQEVQDLRKKMKS